MTKHSPKLRISHVTITPHLVWDDGIELLPGPELQSFDAPTSKAIDVLSGLSKEVALLQSQLLSSQQQNDESAETK